ncbi:uncharacterized protein LOC127790411 [Diospyros lotus]|uniref:uncharacterized protein LOC127790411 n=1 Tax=Diospyros lotus TaxID=55363 RepID=UPI00225C1DA2|nr:uncharacterized protein LOC127790411 [Diospyros lotus]
MSGGMEAEKKRKRGEEGGEGARRKTERESKPEPEATTPTEEEVDEFFAILRRMHEAVTYFKNGKSGGASLLGSLEAEVLSDVNEVKAAEEAEMGVFDLNVAPAAEDEIA